MTIAFSPWPAELAARYRAEGYWLDQPLSELVERQALSRPDALALICAERQFSYGQFQAQAACLAQHLLQRGLRGGDTALVQLPNVAEFYLVLFALLQIGVVPVNALFSHQRLELSAYAQQIRPRLLIAARSHRLFADDEFIQQLQAQQPALQQVLLLGAVESTCSLEACLQQAPAQSWSGRPSAADSVALFQLSGGTTGTPKLIPRTHNDYAYSVRQSAAVCALNTATRFLCALPAGHNYSLSSPGALGVFAAGGCVVLAPDPEPLRCFALIERHQVNMAALVPSAVILWLQAATGRRQQLASLRVLQVGGASFAESLARRVPVELGCRLQQVFGMAEGLVNYTRLEDDDERVFTTQGRPMSPADEVRVLDGEGRQVPPGCTGRLATRGPYTFRGYYQSPEHNAQAFDAEGFYYSGDLVQQDALGYLRVVGRVKDQINRGGEKIAAEELEHLLLKHPAISQAALVAMPDGLLGEKSCAFVVASEPLRAVLLRKFLRAEGVADFKLPDRFEFISQLPLTAVGKTDKPRLRAHLQTLLSVADA